jgi:hypothetical protein
MAGYFPATGAQIELGRARRALYNTALGTQTLLRAEITAYYGYSSGQVSFSATLGGRYYPYTY